MYFVTNSFGVSTLGLAARLILISSSLKPGFASGLAAEQNSLFPVLPRRYRTEPTFGERRRRLTSSVKMGDSFDYDFAVIGGGSGGMAAAKEAAKHGAKTVLLDFVKPTGHGTKWGLGGTCVNVGCVPKKLMHYASLMGPILRHDADTFGWKLNGDVEMDWTKLVGNVQGTVKRLNFGYRTGLRSANVTYINALGKFVDAHTIDYTDGKGETNRLTADKVLIAVGGRPDIPLDIPNARQLAITSDDIFSLKNSPRKTLVVGGAYIALESAGFLTEMGMDVTVAVRSVPLRQFDRQCADKVARIMAEMGTKFLHRVTVDRMDKLPNGKIQVKFNGPAAEDEFDTVLFAAGRQADTALLNLEAVGLKTLPNGKIQGTDEQTSVENIYVVGDCLEGAPELTPTAIKAGELLARRLFAKSSQKMDYSNVASTVFTPVEYGSVGLSEEAAVAKYGENDIEVYLQEFTSLELSAAHREKVESARADEFDVDMSPVCLSKIICVKSDGERVVGFHFVGPNAGEVTQGFALALRLGATKSDFDATVGIHPTDAESFTGLTVTRRSGLPFSFGGCGGGKCG